MTERFALPIAFALLTLIPIILFVWHRRRPGALLFSNLKPLSGLKKTWRQRLRWLPGLCALAAIALLTIAIARPQLPAGRLPAPREGIAIQLVIDRSGSMNEPMQIGSDSARRRTAQSSGQPTKLDAVKQMTHDFLLGDGKELRGRPDDLVGLVTFARYADTVAPLARSHEIIVELARQLQPALVRGEDGTAIGEGLALAAARLKKTEETSAQRSDKDKPAERIQQFNPKSRIIVLMTDGQNNAGSIDPMQAADLCRQWGIKVYTIGIGAGARHQLTGDPFQDMRLQMMGSGVDEESLRQIAELTGGQYFPAADAAALRNVYAQINALEKTEINAPESTLYDERFAPLAAAAGAVVLLQVLLSATIFRRLP